MTKEWGKGAKYRMGITDAINKHYESKYRRDYEVNKNEFVLCFYSKPLYLKEKKCLEDYHIIINPKTMRAYLRYCSIKFCYYTVFIEEKNLCNNEIITSLQKIRDICNRELLVNPGYITDCIVFFNLIKKYPEVKEYVYKGKYQSVYGTEAKQYDYKKQLTYDSHKDFYEQDYHYSDNVTDK